MHVSLTKIMFSKLQKLLSFQVLSAKIYIPSCICMSATDVVLFLSAARRIVDCFCYLFVGCCLQWRVHKKKQQANERVGEKWEKGCVGRCLFRLFVPFEPFSFLGYFTNAIQQDKCIIIPRVSPCVLWYLCISLYTCINLYCVLAVESVYSKHFGSLFECKAPRFD